MKREIKFNAYIKDLNIILENVTVYGINGHIGIEEENLKNKLPENYQIHDDGIYFADEDHFDLIIPILLGDEWVWFEEKQYELMQYIGLKDKKGNEIFEGYIIKDLSERILEIKWNKDYASWCLLSKKWFFHHWFKESCNPEQVEIIGNIFQNPELMK